MSFTIWSAHLAVIEGGQEVPVSSPAPREMAVGILDRMVKGESKMAVTLQTSGGALFPSSKVIVKTVSAAYNNATAISKGSTKSATAIQDRLEISREAKQLFSIKQKSSNSWTDTIRIWP